MTLVRLGTRGSALALLQSETVAGLLRAAHPGLEVELVTIRTAGDRDQQSQLTSGQGTGWFTSAIQDALLANEIDVAVHSYKDLPTKRPEGLAIAAVPQREDPRDAFISRTGRPFRRLPAGSKVGTGSARRGAQLRGIRPDVEVAHIRGNVDSRIQKMRDGEYDAIVLALAGLRRLGRESEATEVFGLEEMLPAPAQGALAVECRTGDTATRTLLAAIDDPELRPLLTAERSFLAALEAGCNFPAAAYAERFGTTLKLNALVAPDGGPIFRTKVGGPIETAAGLGRQVAAELLQLSGAQK